ncbi:hypothetical protein AB837_00115 [bacterium AB1]|nr:hypothetical protein AB837_00115 [bacterium AB1]
MTGFLKQKIIIFAAGCPGSGKTYLSNQICKHLKEKNKNVFIFSEMGHKDFFIVLQYLIQSNSEYEKNKQKKESIEKIVDAREKLHLVFSDQIGKALMKYSKNDNNNDDDVEYIIIDCPIGTDNMYNSAYYKELYGNYNFKEDGILFHTLNQFNNLNTITISMRTSYDVCSKRVCSRAREGEHAWLKENNRLYLVHKYYDMYYFKLLEEKSNKHSNIININYDNQKDKLSYILNVKLNFENK